jgi:hypothetical protein
MKDMRGGRREGTGSFAQRTAEVRRGRQEKFDGLEPGLQFAGVGFVVFTIGFGFFDRVFMLDIDVV